MVICVCMGGMVKHQASVACQGCHGQIFNEHMASQHERSLSNPVFQAQYFGELLPQVAGNPALHDYSPLDPITEIRKENAADVCPVPGATDYGYESGSLWLENEVDSTALRISLKRAFII